MTPVELHRLAGAITCLRPDWPPNSVQTFLQRHLAHRPLRDTAIALITCALDPTTETPARVLEPGPWWKAAATRDTPAARNDCREHPLAQLRVDQRTGQQTCAGCHANHHAAPDSTPTRPDRPIPADARQRIEAALRRTTPDAATAEETSP